MAITQTPARNLKPGQQIKKYGLWFKITAIKFTEIDCGLGRIPSYVMTCKNVTPSKFFVDPLFSGRASETFETLT